MNMKGNVEQYRYVGIRRDKNKATLLTIGLTE